MEEYKSSVLHEGGTLLVQKKVGWGCWWVHAGAGLVHAVRGAVCPELQGSVSFCLLDGGFYCQVGEGGKEHGHAKD